jgi:hypothetical protein
MKFIKKLGVTCATVVIMASTMSHAGVVTTNKLLDNYIGANGETRSEVDAIPNSNFDTKWMKVSRDLSAESLTVKVKSNFVGYDSIYKLGDLFLMDGANYNTAASCGISGSTARGCNENSYTSGTNKWEYAFDLGLDLNDANTTNSTSNYNETGQLVKINTAGDITIASSTYHKSVNTSSQLKDNNPGRFWQIVDVKTPGSLNPDGTPNTDAGSAVGAGGTWKTNTNTDKKFLTMTFDIGGTSLMTSDQIALRWAMSCANDIIEVVANLKAPTTSIPEPSTLLLMSLAGLGLFASRQKKGVEFKA